MPVPEAGYNRIVPKNIAPDMRRIHYDPSTGWDDHFQRSTRLEWPPNLAPACAIHGLSVTGSDQGQGVCRPSLVAILWYLGGSLKAARSLPSLEMPTPPRLPPAALRA